MIVKYVSVLVCILIDYNPLQQRHRSDDQVNNRLSYVLRNGKIVEEKWHKVAVGDIILLKNNDYIAVSTYVCKTTDIITIPW